jgi:hypothetical protein
MTGISAYNEGNNVTYDTPHQPQSVYSGWYFKRCVVRPLHLVARADLVHRERNDAEAEDSVKVVLRRAPRPILRLDIMDERAKRTLEEIQRKEDNSGFLRCTCQSMNDRQYTLKHDLPCGHPIEWTRFSQRPGNQERRRR